MPQFSYRARRRSGELVEGVLDVADRSAAVTQIERLGLFPVAVDTARAGAVNGTQRTGKSVDLMAFLPPTLRAQLSQKRKPKLQELATFTQQLANLIQSGMPLTVALNSMTHLESRGISADVSRELKQEVTEGKGLSDAMAKQPRVFSDLYVNMVPRFMVIFSGFGVELPLPTRLLMGFSNFLRHFWWLLGLLIIVAIILFKRFQASAEGARTLDEWKLNAPVFGKVMKLNLFGQFARTLGTLLQNGVPVLTALKITEQVIANRIVKEAIAKTRDAVTDGKTLAQPLQQSKVFPQLMVDLVRIG